KQRGVIREADVKSKEFGQEKKKAAEQFARLESALAQENDKRTVLQKRIEEDEKRQRELNPQLVTVAAQMEKLKEYERQSSELDSIRKELAALPANAAEEVNRARTVYEGLAALVQLVPQLTRFQEHRDSLRQAKQREQTAKQKLTHVETRGKQLSADLKRLEPLVQEADRAARQAKDQETEARTFLKQASDSLREITEMHGSKVCRHCGQELTPGHLQEEKRRRGEEVQRANERLQKATADLRAAQKEEERLRKEDSVAQKNYQEAREEYREVQSQAQQAHADVLRLQNDCGRAYDEFPEGSRRRISASRPADWLETDYPRLQDLETLRAEAAGHSA